MRKIYLILFMLLVGCSPQPIEKSPTIDLTSNSVMYINGQIFNKHVNQLRQQQTKIKYLVLNSPGGEIDDAYALSLMVKYNSIITIISQNGICNSACTLVFQAGKERHASTTSNLMYHGARLGINYMQAYFNECPSVTDLCLQIYKSMVDHIKAKTIEMFHRLEDSGLSHDVFLRFIKMPTNPNWLALGNLTGYSDLYMTAKESMKYNAVTKIVEYELY